MKKSYILIIILLSSTIFISGWSPFKDIQIYKNLKTDVKTQLQALFGREIEIEEVSGILVNQIELRNVRIAKEKGFKEGSILTAKKIFLNYNPFTLAAHKGNILPALSKIVIIEPEFTVERYADDTWNMLKLIPMAQKGGGIQAPALNVEISIKNGNGWYIDHLGFGESLKGNAFKTKFKNLDVEANISKNKIKLSAGATSIIDRSIAFAKIDGNINVSSGKYNFVSHVKNLDIEKWGHYILNIPDVRPVSGYADMKLTMTNPPQREKGLPILFTGDFYIRNGNAVILGKETKNIYGFIGVHDEDVRFTNLNGTIFDTMVTLNGKLNDFIVANYKLIIQTETFDLKNAGQIAGSWLSKFNVNGKAKARIFITGNYTHPRFNGILNFSECRLLDKEISGPGSFYLEGPILSLKMNGLNTLKGRLSAEGMIDLAPILPTFSINISTEASDIQSLTNVKKGITGTANIATNLTGTINDMRLKGQADLLNCEMLGQRITGSSFDMALSGNAISVSEFILSSGNTMLSASGTIENNSKVDLNIKCSNMKIISAPIQATVNKFNGKIFGLLTPNTTLDPFNDISFMGDLFLSDINIDKQNFYQGNGSIKLKNKILSFDNFLLQVKQSFLYIKGDVGLTAPVNLKISGNDIEISEFFHLKYLIPKELTPYNGKADISIIVTGTPTNESAIKDPFKLFSQLNIAGSVSLKQCNFASEIVEDGAINFSWGKGKMSLEDSKIRTPESNINLYGSIDIDRLIDLHIKGTLELSNLKPFIHKYGRIFGRTGIELTLSGTYTSPNISAVFNCTNLKYNKLSIDGISGNIFYNGELLNLLDPLKINQGNDEYQLLGSILLNKSKDTAKPHFSLDCEIVKGELGTLYGFLDSINSEVLTKQFQVQGAGSQAPLKLKQFAAFDIQKFFDDQRIILYSDDHKEGGLKTAIQSIKDMEKELASYKEVSKNEEKINASGNIQGYIKITGDTENLDGAMAINVGPGNFRSYLFDGIELRAKLKGTTVEIETATIVKEGGTIKLSGNFNTYSTINLDIDATMMPIDFLSLFISEDKPFHGKFNMATKVEGRFQDPSIKVSLDSVGANIANVKFDDIKAELRYKDGVIVIGGIKLKNKNEEASIFGSLPITKDIPIDIIVSLEGESVGLLSFISKDINWIKGSGHGDIRITGNITSPKFNGNLELLNTSFHLKPIDSDFESTNAEMDIANNNIIIKILSTKWIGKKTNNKSNDMALSGSVNIDRLFTEDRIVDLDLKMEDRKLTINIPDLYRGDLILNNLNISGPYHIKQDKSGPTLSGTATIENGEITLPQSAGKSTLPPIGLDMDLEISKNCYVIAGDVQNIISTDFSNLLLNMEVETKGLKITGTLPEPSINGTIKFGRGTINILNREFTLISEERQKILMAANLENVKENQAAFYGGTGTDSALPHLDLTAEIKIKAVEQTEDSMKTPEEKKYKTQDVIIISKISGIPFVKEKERGVTLSFLSFIEDPEKREILPGKYSEQEIKVLLLPEFIKKPLGIAEGGSIDTNDVIVDYLNSRLNAFLLRGIEREVVKSLDLESLTLEYNFGKDLRNIFPAQTAKDIEEPIGKQEAVYGVGVVKGFFDKFYIDMKYSQALEEQAGINKALFNYQITYKLNPTLSVVYYREPLSFIEEENNYYKVTLKAGYYF